ncbi:MAG TPA: class I SAM-dependent methyltransferase, partial [Usitatibacter sp.]|nr:class I SAM-dependent methyltransferase [Usitatibacter sp.]
LLWRGDFQNARQMLNAMTSRAEPKKATRAQSPVDDFNHERQARAQRARTLAALLIPLEADYTIPLRRAPDLREACIEAYGPSQAAALVSLRELLGVNGAHEWRRKGVAVPAIGGRIHPHYGVFAPIRSEYVDLVDQAPLPAAAASTSIAFDVGTGTGVLAAVLARRGIQRVIATDLDPRALACARENVESLALGKQVEIVKADLFPEGRAAIAVCNPPWVPARPSSPLEHGIYDFESRMLRGYLKGLPAHLVEGGEGWLILSDLAEHLGLRTRAELLAWIKESHLSIVKRTDIRPKHPKASDKSDPLHEARKAEVTSLWRLSAAATP